ncbi:unnamed protein product [Trichobilharzia regenti]|nr:unnamed protein product [Trichobilharzia regenti]
MSWLSDLASKAENFLNTLDHSAAEVLKSNDHQAVDDNYYNTNILSKSHDLHSNVQMSSHSRYDMPVTIKPLDLLVEGITTTGCQSLLSSDGGGENFSSVHFSASSNQSSDAFKYSNSSTTHSGQGDQNEISR